MKTHMHNLPTNTVVNYHITTSHGNLLIRQLEKTLIRKGFKAEATRLGIEKIDNEEVDKWWLKTNADADQLKETLDGIIKH